MEPGDGGSSSLEAVASLIQRLKAERRLPTDEELRENKPKLDELRAKIERIRAMAPRFAEVDLSPEVWALVRLSEKPSVSLWSKTLLRRFAASFL
ncbi:MAG: hypothetical protein HY716_10450 [Planctomycetes bacterium]|nr:hypothetical protein [Planctomycetota bacterium]